MVTSAELNLLTVKQLGAIAKELAIVGWHEMRKEDLVRALVQKSRSRQWGDLIRKAVDLAKMSSASKGTVVSQTQGKSTGNLADKSGPSKSPSGKGAKIPPTITKAPSSNPTSVPSKQQPPSKQPLSKQSTATKDTPAKDFQQKGEVRVGGGFVVATSEPAAQGSIKERLQLKRDLSTHSAGEDLCALLVRDPYWLQVYWELTPKTMERTKVALGPYWHVSLPIIRLYQFDPDAVVAHQKRQVLRDVPIHGSVNNWYLDVRNPPSKFQAEIGYLTRDQNFYPVISSNVVETPQEQILDDLDRVDGNWRGVADDLGRIYKLSGGDTNNRELKRIFEQKLDRPMSSPMLTRYRASQQGGGPEKTPRNFRFEVDVDLIVHGKTDPSVQVTVRNEPISVNPDGTFSVRFTFPEKRHVFPIEAEGSDSVETKRLLLTLERNTRFLETLFQEHTDDE